MRLLIIDASGSALDLALRAVADGHRIKYFLRKTPKTEHIGKGLIDRVDDFHEWINWADMVFFADNTRYMKDADGMRAEQGHGGPLVIGPSSVTALWETDRRKGMEVFKAAGIAVPSCKFFNDYDKAIAYVKRENRCFVSKTGGDDKSLSYVSKTAADMVYMLERWKKKDTLKEEFILQELIEGVEMAVGGWHGPAGFAPGWCENWEFKKLMNGDLGVATGEQGTVLRYVRNSKLADKVLKPLSKILQKEQYVGYIDVNCIIDAKGQPWPLEFTMRPGWPTMNIQAVLHGGDFIEWLRDLALGNPQNIFMGGVAIGVVVSIPDYPYSHLTRKDVVGIPVYGITPALRRHIHPCELMVAECPVPTATGVGHARMWATAGDYLMVVSAVALDIQSAREKVYGYLKRLNIPNSPMWRTDIGYRLSKELPTLQAQGYAKGMVFSQKS